MSGAETPADEYDVAIVGFGPIGATLAGLLGQRGRSVCVIDRAPGVFPLPRAAHIDHMGLRTLQEVGALGEVLPEMIPNPGLDFVSAEREMLMRIPAATSSISGLPASLYFHQPGFDQAVREAALALPGVEAKLETLYLDHVQDADGVGVKLRDLPGDRDYEVRSRYLIGADGGPSPVREDAGLKLENLEFDEMWLVLDLILREDAEALGLPDHAIHVCDPARPHTAIPMPGNRYRFELMLVPGEMPAEMERPKTVDRLLAPWLQPGRAKVERAAVYTFHGLVAYEWRNERVLIAGDAGHQMPPFLGQGMCSGLRDATNLAWKLDAVLAGRAPDALLDTYGEERRPHVRAITKAVVDFGEVICTLDAEQAARRDAEILADPRPPEQRLPFRLPQLQPGKLVLENGGSLFVQPEQPVGEGEKLDDRVGPRLLVMTRDAAGPGEGWWNGREDVLAIAAPELEDPDGAFPRWFERRGVEAVVVRPDRYVMWAGAADQIDAATRAAVESLLSAPQLAAK